MGKTFLGMIAENLLCESAILPIIVLINRPYDKVRTKMQTETIAPVQTEVFSKATISLKPSVLRLVDELAREDDRSRSRTISKLIESHPAIKKLRDKPAAGGGV